MAEADGRIAIIGMAGRFPGARDLDAFWKNLREGVESIRVFSDAELLEAGLNPAVLTQPDCVKARGMLGEVDLFDAPLFNCTRREAELMDPQQRLFLECAWEALENAGYDPQQWPGTIGVFAGASASTYLPIVRRHLDPDRQVSEFEIAIGNDKDYLTTCASYKLGLRGPSVVIQTACSTSLVAVHLACQSLLHGECDMALAGGISVYLPEQAAHLYQEGGIASPDGHCRAFDQRAAGTVGGNGVGLVVLRPLDAAIADGDHIRAVILGSAINNDGRLKAGYTAPSVDGQADVIAEAIAVASVSPDTITCIEAHGTGTPLGDPIEVAALTQAFRSRTFARGFCALGSVKTNIGHLDTAAGVAGLIKTVLALEHKVLPASLHFSEPNPRIDFTNSPFYVNARSKPWTAAVPRRAGVSSFGIGGTNAHVVLEEAAAVPESDAVSTQLLVLSARTERALDRAAERLGEHLRQEPRANLADLAFTLQVGRRALPHRSLLVCRDVADAIAGLPSPRRITGVAPATNRAVVMMFPGQGSQQVQMGAGLYAEFPVFRETVDRCCNLLEPVLGLDLHRLIFASPSEAEMARRQLAETAIAQPALFVIEYALAKLWMRWGIRPHALIGHSVGEYVAACLAGVFAEEDILRLLATRGRLVQEQPRAAMLAVRLPEDQIAPMLGGDLSLAAVNGPSRCVVAGPPEAISRLSADLAARGLPSAPLEVSHAFHSSLLDPILPVFRREVERLTLSAPGIPYISSVTGTWISDAEATDPGYWTRHLRETVRYSAGLAEACRRQDMVLLEVGPRHILSSLARQHPACAGHLVLNSLADAGDADVDRVLEALGRLWLAGARVDWPAVHVAPRRRVPAPTYPFERERYWIASAGRPVRPSAPTPGCAAASEPSRGEPQMSAANAPLTAPPFRRVELLRSLLAELIGRRIDDTECEATFLEMGLDSLLLMQFSQTIQKKFGVQVAFRQLLDELPTLCSLGAHLDQLRGPLPSAPVEDQPAAVPSSASDLVTPPIPHVASSQAAPAAAQRLSGQRLGDNDLHGIILGQIALLSRQLALVERAGAHDGAPPVPADVATTAEGSSDRALQPAAGNPSSISSPEQSSSIAVGERFGPWRPINRKLPSSLTARQQHHLDALVDRYTARTRESKRMAEAHRPHLADGIASVGFRLATKEMVYPIVAARSAGSKIWDIDGNEYADFLMGFGVNLFGHQPPFVTAAIEEQLRRGIPIGPQCTHTGDVARMICDLTGAERVTFCNSGSEAVMGALRLARTVTGRTKVALFAGSYHGMSDGVLAWPKPGDRPRARPVVPGIPHAMIDDVLVLDYAAPESLEILAARAGELAAVLVEPVQNAHPDLQPRAFLHELRRITADVGAALIFDEMITGFRIHPGGAQAWFGVQADLATYGKIVGGGLPIGVIAGKALYMDALDGGSWRFGDNSYPRSNQTFFAGTFSKHPLAMAAASAVLRHLKASGPRLQEVLNERTADLVRTLTTRLERLDAPIRVSHFGSLFRLDLTAAQERSSLLVYQLVEKGIYIGDRSGFLSTAHSDAEIDRFVQAVEESVIELREGGFLTEPRRTRSIDSRGTDPAIHRELVEAGCAANSPVPEQSATANALDDAVRTIETTDGQKGLWAAAQLGPETSRAYNESLTLRLRGPLDLGALRRAVQQLVDRHDALRTTFAADGELQHIAPVLKVDVPLIDLIERDPSEQWREAMKRIASGINEPFVLSRGPLVRVRVVRLSPDDHLLSVVMHHIIIDGSSVDVFLQELATLYEAACEGREARLPDAVQFAEFAARCQRQQVTAEFAAAEAYWLEQFVPPVPILELPIDRSRPPVQTYRGAREQRRLDPAISRGLKAVGAAHGATLYMALLATFEIVLHHLTGQGDVVVGIHAAGQAEWTGMPEIGGRPIMGFCVNTLPLRSRIAADSTFATQLAATKRSILEAHQWQKYPLNRLVRRLNLKRDPSHLPLVATIFNVDHVRSRFAFHRLETEFVDEPVVFARFELLWNIVESDEALVLCVTYNADLFRHDTIQHWMTLYEALARAVVRQPDANYAALGMILSQLDEKRRVVAAEAVARTRSERLRRLKGRVVGA